MTSTTRVEAFSDGVLAIAITLLVLDLRVPLRDGLHTSLAHALARQWPSYAAYVTSFLIIGIIWVNHHAVFGYLGAADRMLLFLNLVLLMFVAAIPFTTSLFAEYLTAGRDAHTAAVVYSGVMLAMAVAFSCLCAWAASHPRLLREGVDPAAARGVGRAVQRRYRGLSRDDRRGADQRAAVPGGTFRDRPVLQLPAGAPALTGAADLHPAPDPRSPPRSSQRHSPAYIHGHQ